MHSLWDDAEASSYLDRFADAGEDLALRVYTSQLIGRDETLVLHGGGNTSVKTRVRDRVRAGVEIDVLCVKGSGWNLVDIEPPGLPAVRLEPLRELRGLAALSDDEMVNQIRTQLLDAGAPNPSIETLVHAFAPHKFVDHTHADAVLALTDQPDGQQRCEQLFGDRVAILPWIMPGYPLAEAVAQALDERPSIDGIVLLRHGVISFGGTARDSYERMISLCALAETEVQRARVAVAVPPSPDGGSAAEGLLPRLRGAMARTAERGVYRRFVSEVRQSEVVLGFAARPDAKELCQRGPLTPDHVIRTKGHYLHLSVSDLADRESLDAAFEGYEQRYRDYFESNRNRMPGPLTMLDPRPRVLVVEGFGLVAFGTDPKSAAAIADIAEHTLDNISAAESIGRYDPLPAGELFEMEYWELEQRKLRKPIPSLRGHVSVITGAAGAIGRGVAIELGERGACLVLSDLEGEALHDLGREFVERFGSARVLVQPADVCSAASVDELFAVAARRFGGVDSVVPNAGIAKVAELSDLSDEDFAGVMDVNLQGVQRCLRAAARLLKLQDAGGDIVVQASKNVFAPGAGFGAYSASKAGALQLARIAAMELAPFGVRVNAINADAVFGDQDRSSGLWDEVGPDRMRSRGLDPSQMREFYRDRSLLRVEVTPRHVGRAVAFFVEGATPTTGAVLPVDAGVAGAFPR
ncbi:MAG: bifunctional aldolase/short-chain dehydrogenase [Planctomycetota bacterium]